MIEGMLGLYCLIATSAFMSLMFPTIYGIALSGLGEDTKIAAAGLHHTVHGKNHNPALVPLPNGDLLATWFSASAPEFEDLTDVSIIGTRPISRSRNSLFVVISAPPLRSPRPGRRGWRRG